MTEKTQNNKSINVGGQAVIEGVMMRSPDYVAIAVRKPNGKIVLKKNPFQSWTKRIKFLGWPFIRGGITLIESLVIGIRALNFSSNIAMAEIEKEENKKKKKKKKERSKSMDNLITGGTLIFAMCFGFALFFYIPLLLTEWTGVKSGVMFNVIDGGIRLGIFLIYLFLISLWKEIRRIFEYHGAEHKSIFAFENGVPLSIKNVKPFTTHHPRCGTSFILVVMIVSILVFIPLGRPESIPDRLIRFLFIPVIGGISYEIIRLSGKAWGKWFAKILVYPGLMMQYITTKEPDEQQLEVALTALKGALGQDIEPSVEISNDE